MQLMLPLTKEDKQKLLAGMCVTLSGSVYTARDAAHARFMALIDSGKPLPFPIENNGIYYTGPCPSKPGQLINSCGPTTSSRMDAFAPVLYDLGLAFVIGKGPVSKKVRSAIVRNGAVYFVAVGGAGALIASHVTQAKDIAFEDLGSESVRLIRFDKLPLIVAIDCYGKCVYDRKNCALQPKFL